MSDKEFAKGNIVFFFCDMVKSTSIARTLGKTRFDAEVLAPYHALLNQVLNANQGREIQYTGDGVFAVFHTPQQAVAAARQLQEGLRDVPIPVMIGDKESLCMARVGLHRSIVDLQPDANGLYPEAYSEIAYSHRVMEPGNDGQILVSKSLWIAIEGKKQTGDWTEWGNRYLKSYSEAPQSLYELLWDGVTKGEPGARWLPDWYVREINLFIGRVAPMQRIEKWLKEAKRPLLTLHGTGGIGKTRLAVETVIQLGGEFPAGVAFVSLDRESSNRIPSTSLKTTSRAR